MNIKKGMLQLVEKTARIKIEQDSYRWPPPCIGIFHHPKRPLKMRRK